jgi:drug/metabolite transporter (DMT)-like permease
MWILATFLAAGFQAGRTSLQHRLRALLSVSGAGFVRYVYGAPLAVLAVTVSHLAGAPLPNPPLRFWPIVVVAGVAQIFGTVFLIRAFDARGFAIGTVFSKTEVVQVAVFSALFLGESLRWLGWISAFVCLGGIVLLVAKEGVAAVLQFDRGAMYGLAAGGLFGLAAVSIRAASKSLSDEIGSGHVFMRALFTLAVMNTLQTVLHGGYLLIREPEQVRLACKYWRSSAIVGVLSVCGSAAFALGFTMQNAARVRMVGQIELLFTFAISRLILRDRHVRSEYLAAALVLLGVVGVLIAG